MQVHKSFGTTSLCCWRPGVQIFTGDGEKIGHVEDPWRCCLMDERIYDAAGLRIYGAAGLQIYGATLKPCQPAVFCPCLGNVEFEVTGPGGEPTSAHISKLFGGCAEVVAKVHKLRVVFPAGATPAQKMALLGATLLIDFEYFERK